MSGNPIHTTPRAHQWPWLNPFCYRCRSLARITAEGIDGQHYHVGWCGRPEGLSIAMNVIQPVLPKEVALLLDRPCKLYERKRASYVKRRTFPARSELFGGKQNG